MIRFNKWDDKDTHMLVGCIIAILTSAVVWYFTPITPMVSGIIGVAFSVIAGYCKEKYDVIKKKKEFSMDDLISTFYGGIVGATIITVFLLNI